MPSSRGIDKAAQKLRFSADVDCSNSLMRAAKLTSEHRTSICAIDKKVDKTCTMTAAMFRCAATTFGNVPMYLWSRIRNNVSEAENVIMRQPSGKNLEAIEALIIFFFRME